MAVVLKFCPVCSHHFPTRSSHVVCSICRHVAKQIRQLGELTPQQRGLVAKLQKNGFTRQRALREVTSAQGRAG